MIGFGRDIYDKNGKKVDQQQLAKRTLDKLENGKEKIYDKLDMKVGLCMGVVVGVLIGLLLNVIF